MKGEKAMGMKGFKGFEKDFSCKGKQYEENTTYEEHGVDAATKALCTSARTRGRF